MEKKEDKGRDRTKRRDKTKEGESENIRVRGEGKGEGEVSMRYPKPVGRICPEAVIDKVSLSQPHICICFCYWERVLSALFFTFIYLFINIPHAVRVLFYGVRLTCRGSGWTMMVANRISSSLFHSIEHCRKRYAKQMFIESEVQHILARYVTCAQEVINLHFRSRNIKFSAMAAVAAAVASS